MLALHVVQSGSILAADIVPQPLPGVILSVVQLGMSPEHCCCGLNAKINKNGRAGNIWIAFKSLNIDVTKSEIIVVLTVNL